MLQRDWMKLVVLFFSVYLTTTVYSMESNHELQQARMQRELLIQMMTRFEAKKKISTTTYNNIINGSPKSISTILSELDHDDIATFRTLDKKERTGAQLTSQESECLNNTIQKIITTSMIGLCEKIYQATKSKYVHKQEKDLLKTKNNIQNLLKIFAEYDFITKLTHQALLQEEHFEILVKTILQDEKNLQAVEKCTHMLPLFLSGKTLTQQENFDINSSIARFLFVRPVKKFESIIRSLQSLRNNKKITSDSHTFFDTLENFLKFYKVLSPEQIELFLKYNEQMEPSQKIVSISDDLVKKICSCVNDFVSKQKKLKYVHLTIIQPETPLTEEELKHKTKQADEKLEKELEEILLNPLGSDDVPRSPTPEETEPYIRKTSDPQSPAIPIKSPGVKFTVVEKKS